MESQVEDAYALVLSVAYVDAEFEYMVLFEGTEKECMALMERVPSERMTAEDVSPRNKRQLERLLRTVKDFELPETIQLVEVDPDRPIRNTVLLVVRTSQLDDD